MKPIQSVVGIHVELSAQFILLRNALRRNHREISFEAFSGIGIAPILSCHKLTGALERLFNLARYFALFLTFWIGKYYWLDKLKYFPIQNVKLRVKQKRVLFFFFAYIACTGNAEIPQYFCLPFSTQ